MKRTVVGGAMLATFLMLGGMLPVQAASAADVAYEASQQPSGQNKADVGKQDAATPGAYIESERVFQPAALSVSTSDEYRLAKYDVISLDVVGFPQGLGYYTGSSQVSSTTTALMIGPDGRAAIPYIGNVKLAGLTVDEARDLIRDRLSEYIRIPSMSVSIREYGKRKVYVMGEVSKPGIQALDIDSLNAYAAITSAGGFTKRGRSTQVQVIRVIDGVMYYRKLDIKSFIKKHDLNQNVALQDGDIIYVPTSNAIIWNEDVLPYINVWALYRSLTR